MILAFLLFATVFKMCKIIIFSKQINYNAPRNRMFMVYFGKRLPINPIVSSSYEKNENMVVVVCTICYVSNELYSMDNVDFFPV